MVRLVFRPYTQLRRSICTSESLRPSIRVSPDFSLARHSSPSFGSQRACSGCSARDEVEAKRRGCAPPAEGKGSPLGGPGAAFAFTAPLGFVGPLTCTHARLLGPCFKTGRTPHRSTRDRGTGRADRRAAGARTPWGASPWIPVNPPGPDQPRGARTARPPRERGDSQTELLPRARPSPSGSSRTRPGKCEPPDENASATGRPARGQPAAAPRGPDDLYPKTATSRWPPFTTAQFHVLLNSLFKVLFNFPSRYLFAIGLGVVFSLTWSLPGTSGCTSKQPYSGEEVGAARAAALRAYHPLRAMAPVKVDFDRPARSDQTLPNTTFRARPAGQGSSVLGSARFIRHY